MKRHLSRSCLVAAIALIAACNNDCGQSAGDCTSSACAGSSGQFTEDTLWKTDIPKDLADSSASATVTVLVGFASTPPTSADSALITSSGGTIFGNGIVLRDANLVPATFPSAKLIALANSYTGTDITSLTLANGSLAGTGSGSGSCTPTG